MPARELRLAVEALGKIMIDLAAGSGRTNEQNANAAEHVVIKGDIDATRYLAFELACLVGALDDDVGRTVASVWRGEVAGPAVRRSVERAGH